MDSGTRPHPGDAAHAPTSYSSIRSPRRRAKHDAVGNRRAIGRIGTVTRIIGGLAAITVPIAVSGIRWWDVGVALVVLPPTAVTAAAAIPAPRRLQQPTADGQTTAAEAWLRNLVVLLVVIAVEVGLTFTTPLDGAVSIWAFIGISLLVAALRGDGGCEAAAIPNALAGRRDPVGCLVYAPIDALER